MRVERKSLQPARLPRLCHLLGAVQQLHQLLGCVGLNKIGQHQVAQVFRRVQHFVVELAGVATEHHADRFRNGFLVPGGREIHAHFVHCLAACQQAAVAIIDRAPFRMERLQLAPVQRRLLAEILRLWAVLDPQQLQDHGRADESQQCRDYQRAPRILLLHGTPVPASMALSSRRPIQSNRDSVYSGGMLAALGLSEPAVARTTGSGSKNPGTDRYWRLACSTGS